jgi:hypothetical protein
MVPGHANERNATVNDDGREEALERLAHDDPCGMAMFGSPFVMDDDGRPPYVDPEAWMNSHLNGKPRK